MELSDFKYLFLKDGEITVLDMYRHKGLDFVEHSLYGADEQFDALAGEWNEFSIEEKIEILTEFLSLYKKEMGQA